MLKLEQLNAYYGDLHVVRDLNLELHSGEVLCLFGRNGAGKSTALKSLMGLVQRSGSIMLNGEQLVSLPAHLIPRHGIGYVPQGRRLFAELTVAENITIGLMGQGLVKQGLMKRGMDTKARETRAQALALFPQLAPRLQQISGTLSGGEQQMLAIVRCLCLQPKVILLDEPTEGLMPSIIATIREVIAKLRHQGAAILLVEQRVEAVLAVADRVAFIENGRIREVVATKQLNQNHTLLDKQTLIIK